jgi:hypothetical protein
MEKARMKDFKKRVDGETGRSSPEPLFFVKNLFSLFLVSFKILLRAIFPPQMLLKSLISSLA